MPAITAATATAMEPATTTELDEEVLALLDLSNIKRKKSKKVRDCCGHANDVALSCRATLTQLTRWVNEQSKKNKESSEDSSSGDDRGDRASNNDSSPVTLHREPRLPDPYSYAYLLDRVYSRLYAEMPQLQTRQRGIMPAFVITRQRRTILWTNFLQVCNAMGRNPQHVMSFVTTGTSPSRLWMAESLALPCLSDWLSL